MTEEIKARIEQINKGEVPEGYSVNQPYTIPANWSTTKMSKLTEYKSRKNKNKQELVPYSINNEIGFIPQAEQFEDGGYENTDKTAYKIVYKDEFAYNPARVNVGSIGRLKDSEEVMISSLYVCFSVKHDLRSDYLEHWIKDYDFKKEILRNLEGSVREYLFYENFSNIRMPVPPLPEQEKIAEILTTCDKLITLKKELITEKENQKKWLMQNLLNPDSGMRLSGFDGEWEEVKIGDILKIKHGRDQKAIQKANGKYPILASGGEIGRTDTAIYSKPSVLIGRKGTIDNPMFINTPFWTVDTLFYSTISDSVNPKWVYYIFCNINWRQYNAATGVPSLNASVIENIGIYKQTFEEQTAIANILSKADEELTLLNEELSQLQQNKKALMQLLLTGIVRVSKT